MLQAYAKNVKNLHLKHDTQFIFFLILPKINKGPIMFFIEDGTSN
jgi:hypothetical protein